MGGIRIFSVCEVKLGGSRTLFGRWRMGGGRDYFLGTKIWSTFGLDVRILVPVKKSNN